ncbi:MAG: hypothetical protein HYZ39_23840 [Mycolicibacterium cosmeticum]|nr:hypothetical protein [Mycolicibacterium cosmeticum]
MGAVSVRPVLPAAVVAEAAVVPEARAAAGVAGAEPEAAVVAVAVEGTAALAVAPERRRSEVGADQAVQPAGVRRRGRRRAAGAALARRSIPVPERQSPAVVRPASAAFRRDCRRGSPPWRHPPREEV